MTDRIVLRSSADMTLAQAERLAFDGADVEIGEEAVRHINRGRARFESFLEARGGYVYGSTTAPGSRAKVLLSEQDSLRQGETLRNFVPSRAGASGAMLSERCVKLAIFARLSNAMTGSGKLRSGTTQAIANLLHAVPDVPLHGVACSGEVMPLTWLMAPLLDLPLAIGEAMALVNGSPFATAMACDVAFTTKRRLRLAELVFALSIEAAECPAAHFDRRLAEGWKDSYYADSLNNLHTLLRDSTRKQLRHQAPTSWRVIPNILASAWRSVAQVSQSAEIGLQSLKDNPTFIRDPTGEENDVVLSSAGYHDHRASKDIDQVNSALADLCELASRQVTHMLDGVALGLPPLLARPGEGVGAEYLAWAMTEPLATVRRAAEATTLAIGLQDPAGNQSDIASLSFVAYGKHLEVVRSFDVCLACLAVTAMLAVEFRDNVHPLLKRWLLSQVNDLVRSVDKRVDVVGEPLRQTREFFRQCVDGMSTTEFAQHMAGDS